MQRTVRIAAIAAAIVVLSPVAAHAGDPQVIDPADDAYHASLGVPAAVLSDPAYDITEITWAHQGRNEFTVTMTLKGTPVSGVNYYPSARIGAGHIAFWIFRVGGVGRYNIFQEDASGDRTAVSTTTGSAVQVSGNTISATFGTKNNQLPALLRQYPVLGPFGGLTCEAPDDCTGERTIDQASSSADARFTLR